MKKPHWHTENFYATLTSESSTVCNIAESCYAIEYLKYNIIPIAIKELLVSKPLQTCWSCPVVTMILYSYYFS